MQAFHRTWANRILACAMILLCAAGARGQDVVHLADFEAADDLKGWDINSGTPKLVEGEGVTHGKKALEIAFDPKGEYHGAYMSWRKVRADWSGYDALILDVFNPGSEPIPASLLIADKAWVDKDRSYWNRHNGAMTCAPGRTRWVIPVGGLYRGEAGSRNNDIKRNIDVNSIVRLDFGFGAKGAQGKVVIDDLRLVKVNRPAGVWAFDLGPEDQSITPGWTGVSNKSVYKKETGYGWIGGAPWAGAARDTTFGPALLRDFCEAGGYRFKIDVPKGRYAVTLIYENSGYWGGEQAQHTTRRVLVGEKEVWSEKRPDGPAHALYRFEDVEPIGRDGKPVDIWDTYMKDELAKPVKFEAEAGADGLTLKFEADRTFGSKVSALAVTKADDAEGAKWIAGQLDEVAAEFRAMAVCLDKPAPKYDLPAAWKPLGLVAWPVDLEDEITPNSLPPASAADPKSLSLSRLATRGEIATFCLAIRASEAGPVRVSCTCTDPQLPAEVLSVWYNASRGFSNIAWQTSPHTLRPVGAALTLGPGVTRELVLKVRIPADAKLSDYPAIGAITFHPDNPAKGVTIPLQLKISPVVLDRQTDFRMGFFGIEPPEMLPPAERETALEQTLVMLKDNGMNMVCGGPNWKLTGWKNGEPVIDFTEMDAFVALLKKHGFTGPLNGYGGCRFVGLHEGYEKGAVAAKVAKDSGLPYEEAFMKAWKAVDAHARTNGWPVIWYAMCDETRVKDVAQRELEFMQLMAKVSAAFPKTVRTSGSYSVSFAKRPTDPNDLSYWHQQFFGALDISDLNDHDPTVMAEAAKLGKDVHIYNQGTSRYSFGLYQWAEFRQGVKARTQWHLNVLHGYQFFDLDGREPDTAMICYGRKGLYPTIAFERCRAGAQDFYLYNTLARRIEQARKDGRKDAAIDAAAELLDKATASVKLNQRQAPKGFDPDAFKAQVISALEALSAR